MNSFKPNIPLYKQIINKIIDKLIDGSLVPGQMLASEYKLSKDMDVSRLTARKAYQELVDNGILESIRGKGTFVKNDINVEKIKLSRSSERSSNGNIIGIIFPEITQFFAEVIKEIENCARLNGYILNIMFNDTPEKEVYAMQEMVNNNVRGIIMTPNRHMDKNHYEYYEEITKKGIPIVLVGKPPFNVICDAVYVDDIHPSYQAVEYLIKNNHTKIFHITDSKGDKVAYIERKSGYELAMEKNHLDENLRIIDVNNNNLEYDLHELIVDNNYTAAFCNSDKLVPTLLNYINKIGLRCPNDFHIIGYDDTLEYLGYSNSISITSVRQPKAQLGKCAFKMLNNAMKMSVRDNEFMYAYHKIMKPRIIFRDSTKSKID